MPQKIKNYAGRNYKRMRSEDKISKKKRSLVMSKIRSRGTAFEKAVIELLEKKIRRKVGLNVMSIKGKPDIVFARAKVCIFLDSDFWHGWQYPRWKHLLKDDFWRTKIEKNRARDKKTTAYLKRDGWTVVRLWEHNIKKGAEGCVGKIQQALGSPMKTCLPKRIDRNTIKVLILGSFPGEESLRRGEYYAYRQNQFWPIIFEVMGKKMPEKYSDKIKVLNKAGIGLWDVIHSCEREGSSDQKIRNVKVNDLEVLNGFPKVKAVFFNGKTSEKLFCKHYDVLEIHAEYLPSTSPLNTQKRSAKLKSWHKIRKFLK